MHCLYCKAGDLVMPSDLRMESLPQASESLINDSVCLLFSLEHHALSFKTQNYIMVHVTALCSN